MSKVIWMAGILIFIIAIGSAYVLMKPQPVSAPTDTSGGGNAAVGANGESVIVTYTSTGFNPASIRITPGTTVTWHNQSSSTLSINGNDSVSEGGTYSSTFTQPGTFPYSNSNKESDIGTIIVSDEPSVKGSLDINVSSQ